MIKASERRDDEKDLVEYIDQQRLEMQKQGFVAIAMKHSTFINFTEFNREQPTYLNVIRNPIDRYISHYYTCRNGKEGNPNSGGPCKEMSDEQLNRPVDEHFQNIKAVNQSYLSTAYVHWLCGTKPICFQTNNENFSLQKKYEYTKSIALNQYHSIGLLERLRDSLRLFEKIMPRVYHGAVAAYDNEEKVMKATHNSKTINVLPISNKTRTWLERTHFKYDMDLYRYVVAKFNLQFERFVGDS